MVCHLITLKFRSPVRNRLGSGVREHTGSCLVVAGDVEVRPVAGCLAASGTETLSCVKAA
jgi:hypothetical protein